MVVKRTLGNITKGADLLKPKPSFEYIMAAVVGVSVLMLVYKGAEMAVAKFSSMGQSYNPYAPKPDYAAALGII